MIGDRDRKFAGQLALQSHTHTHAHAHACTRTHTETHIHAHACMQAAYMGEERNKTVSPVPHHNFTNTSNPQTFFGVQTLFPPESRHQPHQHKPGDLTKNLMASPLEIHAQSILVDSHEFIATRSKVLSSDD